MIDSIFSMPIYSGKVYDYRKFETLVDDYINTVEPKNTSNLWQCNVTTTYNGSEDFEHQWQYEFVDSIKYNFFEYVNTLNYSDKEYDFDPPWVNIYKKNDFQEMHDHLPSHFSYAYAHKLPESSGDFIFINQGNYNTYTHYENPNVVCKKLKANILEKHILFFPSCVCHMVTPNKSDNLRITISGNITIKWRKV